MNVLEQLNDEFGGRWSGVRFHYGSAPVGPLARHEMRLCEAIAKSFDEPLVLPVDLISCPGARRSLGLDDNDEGLARSVSKNTGVALDSVRKAILATPKLRSGLTAITLGRQFYPDIAVAYARPEIAMQVVRRWQGAFGVNLAVDLSTFMAICGNAVVACYKTGRIRLSLGCPSSRGHGILNSDHLVIAIPSRSVEAFLRLDDCVAHV
jgi:uncharacterized protein (DUF169 family)